MQGDPIRKSVFCVFFQGDKLKQKVSKICEGYVLVTSIVLFLIIIS